MFRGNDNDIMRLIFTIIITVIHLTLVLPQTSDLKFEQISLEQGLSQSTVMAIVQDNQGFIWMGTQAGLNRYDGYSIKIFKHDQSDTNSISDNAIWSLLVDKDGNLWIGTEQGGLE